MEIQELAKDLFQGKEVRILGTLEEPLFVANDIGDLLGIKKLGEYLKDYDETKKVPGIIGTLGGKQQMTLLTEKGLYSVLFTSRKKEAVLFQDWVFRVIKEIRLRGRYVLAEDIAKHQLELQLEESRSEIEQLRKGYKPTVIYHELDINDFTNQPCVYLFHLSGNDYKFGVSGEIDVRQETHLRAFRGKGCDPKLIKVWKCETMQIMKDTEYKIKLFAKHNDILKNKYEQTEIIETDNISHVVNCIDKYVNSQNSREDKAMRIRESEIEIRKMELEIEKLRLINEGKRLDLQSRNQSYQLPPTIHTTPIREPEDNIASEEDELMNIIPEIEPQPIIQQPIELPINRPHEQIADPVTPSSTDKKQSAREWIKINLPNENETTTDYYKRYCEKNNQSTPNNQFGKIVEEFKFIKKSNGRKRYWVKK